MRWGGLENERRKEAAAAIARKSCKRGEEEWEMQGRELKRKKKEGLYIETGRRFSVLSGSRPSYRRRGRDLSVWRFARRSRTAAAY